MWIWIVHKLSRHRNKLFYWIFLNIFFHFMMQKISDIFTHVKRLTCKSITKPLSKWNFQSQKEIHYAIIVLMNLSSSMDVYFFWKLLFESSKFKKHILQAKILKKHSSDTLFSTPLKLCKLKMIWKDNYLLNLKWSIYNHCYTELFFPMIDDNI